MPNFIMLLAIWGAIMSGFGGLMAIVKTNPDEIRSNISKYLEWAGIHTIPVWLQSRRVDQLVFCWSLVMMISITLIFIGFGLGYKFLSQAPTLPPIPFADEEVQGELKPANDPTPPNGCDALPFPIPPDTIKILIGDNPAAMSGLGKTTALEIRSCEAASIERTPDGVFFNANLVDSDGNQVVRILRNKVDALNGETYTTRQSRDQGSLTVTNKIGNVLFYARYLNKETVRIRGFFGCGGHPPVKVADNQPIPGVLMSGGCSLNSRVLIHID
jgi:hypothetical protein